jgi:hypothetical protein
MAKSYIRGAKTPPIAINPEDGNCKVCQNGKPSTFEV